MLHHWAYSATKRSVFRSPAPPIMIGGGGEKRTVAVVARHADMWNAFGTPETIEHKIAVLRDHCRSVGRDPAAITLTVGANVVIRRDRASAEAVYAHQRAVAHATDETNVTKPHQRWIGTVDDIVARTRAYIALGIEGLIVEMPAPLDLETIEALARDVRPQLG